LTFTEAIILPNKIIQSTFL